MKKIAGVFILVVLISCNSKKEKLIYQDYSNKYYAKIDESDKNGSVDTLYTFYDFNDPEKVREVGFIKDGLHNGLWSYNLNSGAKTIDWGYYQDTTQNFQTNIFAKADSLIHQGAFSKFIFNTGNDKLILTIAINSPVKDSLTEKNYKQLMEEDFAKIGVVLNYFQTKKLINNGKDIYISEIKAYKPSTNKIRFEKDAYCFLDKNNFVEISIGYSNEKNVDADILFNAVLTSFFINGKILYDPFVPSTISYPDWAKSKTDSTDAK
jgi:hypothetical protein